MRNWYLNKMRESNRLDDKLNYSKMARVPFNVKTYITRHYLREHYGDTCS